VLDKNVNNISAKVAETIFTNVGKKVADKKEDFEKYQKNNNINRILKDNVMFDSSEKIKVVQFIIDSIDHELTAPHKNSVFSEGYSALKKTRDLLAHVIEDIKDGKKILRSGNQEIEFTDELCVDLRFKVRKHNNDLDSILRMLLS